MKSLRMMSAEPSVQFQLFPVKAILAIPLATICETFGSNCCAASIVPAWSWVRITSGPR